MWCLDQGQEIGVKKAFFSGVMLALTSLAGCGDPVESTQTQTQTEPPTQLSGGETSPPAYSARAFFETTFYSLAPSRAWSADGSRLLVGSDESGTFNAYTLAVDGSGGERLTDSTETAHRPVSWFPHDDRILFIADRKGDELGHVFVRELNGAVRDLTPGEGHKAIFAGWVGDGEQFFLMTTERDPGAFDLYLYSATDYSRELVFQNDDAYSPARVSRDGRFVALLRGNSSSDNDIFLYDLEGRQSDPVHITPHDGSIRFQVHDFAPDGSALVYGTNEHSEFSQAWSYEIDTGDRQPLIQADWDVSYAFYSESGHYLIYGINEDGRINVRVEDTESGEKVSIPGLPAGDLTQVKFAPDENRLALMVSTDTSPRDIYVVDRNSQRSRRLTTAANPEIDEAELVDTEVVRYRSFDGLEIPGILYKPKRASPETPVPALVWVHGGPGGQSRQGYSATLQHLVNHGYAVLAANNRGSSGYGKTFYHMDDRKHGEVDLDDIVHAGEYLAALDWVDPDRIGIIGGSYGGYMVGAALAFRPEAFKVGVNIFGVMNWLRTLESIPPWWEANRKSLYDELGDPATDGERLRRISPLFHAENIQVPLLVVQGANDPRVLQVESDEIVAAVRKNELPVEYIVFEDEGHGFAQRENRITASDAYVAFLNRYL
jgi:dipeptidyl aminopeptidase/acylaminoacyl peptidase